MNYENWFACPAILAELGPLLAEPVRDAEVDLIVGPESSGFSLAPLVAVTLGCGYVRVKKDRNPAVDSVRLVEIDTRPDHEGYYRTLSVKAGMIPAGSRVYAIDDIVDSGSQIEALKYLVERCSATWLGASVLIDNLDNNRARVDLKISALFNARDV